MTPVVLHSCVEAPASTQTHSTSLPAGPRRAESGVRRRREARIPAETSDGADALAVLRHAEVGRIHFAEVDAVTGPHKRAEEVEDGGPVLTRQKALDVLECYETAACPTLNWATEGIRVFPRRWPLYALCFASFVTVGTVNLWTITDTKGISKVIPVLNKMRWTKGPLRSFIVSTSS